jgi:predicted ATPase
VVAGLPAYTRRVDAPFVGRVEELAALERELDRAAVERSCRLCTVVGEAGIGKSRLVREFVREVAPEATVRVGRCPAYGDGITFWPLARSSAK